MLLVELIDHFAEIILKINDEGNPDSAIRSNTFRLTILFYDSYIYSMASNVEKLIGIIPQAFKDYFNSIQLKPGNIPPSSRIFARLIYWKVYSYGFHNKFASLGHSGQFFP